jgi:hypothetical protein
MSELGILIYGYDEKRADRIRSSINEILEVDVLILTASTLESEKVGDILEECHNDKFEDKSVKILMFLGFTDGQIDSVLKGFPKNEGLIRPIFCGLTENNIKWKFQELMDDLVKEEEYWAQKRNKREED